MSSELDQDLGEETKTMKERQDSRNKLHVLDNSKDTYENRVFHQTTSSGNLVLYDSVARTSTQSPQEMFDPRLVEKFVSRHKNAYEDNHESDDEDLLQNNHIAGKFSKEKFIFLDENMAYMDEEYEEEDTEEVNPRIRKHINQYIHQLSGSKFQK